MHGGDEDEAIGLMEIKHKGNRMIKPIVIALSEKGRGW
jgi:hypothetical protein